VAPSVIKIMGAFLFSCLYCYMSPTTVHLH
jgi:hypothetical protein